MVSMEAPLPVTGGETPWFPLVLSLAQLDGEEAPADKDHRMRLRLAILAGDEEAAKAEAEQLGDGLREFMETSVDRSGLTPLDLARGLGRWSLAQLLTGKVPALEELAAAQLRSSLEGMAEAEGLSPTSAELLVKSLQLHEYGMLSLLARAAPASVHGSVLRRSMSCMECWFADLYGRGCAPALPGHMYLISCWDHFESFQFRDLPDGDGEVVCPSGASAPAPTVAEQATFKRRFVQRTGGLLEEVDWANIMVIGGMVLACATCDDAAFERHFPETDVDIYVVGVHGKEFRAVVHKLLEHLGRRAPRASVVRTAQTITVLPGRSDAGKPLPNIQVILAPYCSKAHLLFTTDIDCTAMGFDGARLLATPRAREALARRRNVVRPEKYSVRGEWRTESRYLKYARRGFRAVDLGLQPGQSVATPSEKLLRIVAKAQPLMARVARALDELREKEAQVRNRRAASRRSAEEWCGRLRTAAGLMAGDWLAPSGVKVRLREAEPDRDELRGLAADVPKRSGGSASEDTRCVEVRLTWDRSNAPEGVSFNIDMMSVYPGQLSLQTDGLVPSAEEEFLQRLQTAADAPLESYTPLSSLVPIVSGQDVMEYLSQRAEASSSAPLQAIWWKERQSGFRYHRDANGKFIREKSPPPARWTRPPQPFPDEVFADAPVPARWRSCNEDQDELWGCAEEDLSEPPTEQELSELQEAQTALQALCGRVVKQLGVHGARLLLFAKELPELAAMLLEEVPSLRAGMDRDEVADLLEFREPEDAGSDAKDVCNAVNYHGSYGRQRAQMVLVNPAPGQSRRCRSSFRNREMSPREAIKELDLESDRFETRGWYDGLAEDALQEEFACLDPAVWRGVGDFRKAA